MNLTRRKTLAMGAGLAAASTLHSLPAAAAEAGTSIQLVRSATIRVKMGDAVFLVDPMLSDPASWPGFPLTVNSEARNPLIPLPMPAPDAVKGIDAVILTHLHEDHWDEAARKILPKDIPVFVNDRPHLDEVRKAGFRNAAVLEPGTRVKGVSLTPLASQHGTPSMLAARGYESLGTTMGIFFEKAGCRSVYVAGDTVWTATVSGQIARLRPGVIVLNTGNALLTEFPASIIMGAQDFLRAYREAPWASVVAVHMDAINHCVLKRKDLRDLAQSRGLDPRRALIPADGEILRF